MNEVLSRIPNIKHTGSGMFFLMAGPCVVEDADMLKTVAETACRITERLRIPYIFKASYRKANRSRLDSFSGIGDEKALKLLADIRRGFGVPVVTDIHNPEEAAIAAEYVDVLQIPAFLCRQTDLLVAAAKTGKVVNIKKGQFLAPEAMSFAAGKVRDAGNPNVMLTDRGTTFGYYDLIVDMRGIPAMQNLGYGHYPFVAAAQPDERRDRRAARNDRNHCARIGRGRRRWSFYRNASEPGHCEKRRGEYAGAGSTGKSSRTAGADSGDDQRIRKIVFGRSAARRRPFVK